VDENKRQMEPRPSIRIPGSAIRAKLFLFTSPVVYRADQFQRIVNKDQSEEKKQGVNGLSMARDRFPACLVGTFEGWRSKTTRSRAASLLSLFGDALSQYNLNTCATGAHE